MNSADISTETTLHASGDGGQFAVTRVAPAHSKPASAPVVFIPGLFSGRSFWLSNKGIGLAAHLVQSGHSCWIVERRGIGAAPRSSRNGPRAGLEEHLRYDLPEVQRMIMEREERAALWCAHSFGGVMLARAVAETLSQEHMAGLILFASQCEVGLASMRPPASYLMRACSAALRRFPARRLGLGSEDEPAAAITDACRWTTAAQRSSVWFTPLSGITVPVLAVVGAGDRFDPPEGCERFIGHMSSHDKTFITAGLATDFREDYNHPGVVVSKSAQQEIWPLVAEWIHARVQQGFPADSSASAS